MWCIVRYEQAELVVILQFIHGKAKSSGYWRHSLAVRYRSESNQGTHAIVCDAPARCMVQDAHQFNGAHGELGVYRKEE